MLDAMALCICVSTANKQLALVLLHQPLYCCTNILFVPATDHDTAKAADHYALQQSQHLWQNCKASMQTHPLKTCGFNKV